MAAETKTQLAQYFTPPAVAAFAFDALGLLGMEPPRRVADPACGEGVFLRLARERFPEAELWGCDLDGALAAQWHAAGLTAPTARLLVQDGLDDAPWHGLTSGSFDLVVGNPPYGFKAKGGQVRFLRSTFQAVPGKRTCPPFGGRIEALFLKRFVELARRGGWIAIIVPEGILANARSQKLRDGFLRQAALRAVVALPESTFGRTGTRARTALLFARKGGEAEGDAAFISPTERRAGASVSSYLGDALAALRAKTAGGKL